MRLLHIFAFLLMVGSLFAYNSTGGTMTYDGSYTVVTFTANSSFNVTGTITNATVLVVAGGGGGSEGDGIQGSERTMREVVRHITDGERVLARFTHEILLRHRICPHLLRCASFPSSTYCMEYAFVGTASRALQLRASPPSRDGFHE